MAVSEYCLTSLTAHNKTAGLEWNWNKSMASNENRSCSPSSSHTQTYNSYIDVNGRDSSGYIPYCRTGQLQLRVCFERACAKIGIVYTTFGFKTRKWNALTTQPKPVLQAISNNRCFEFFTSILSTAFESLFAGWTEPWNSSRAGIKSTVRSIR